jgi:hypothetical protein
MSTSPDTWVQVCGPLVMRLDGDRVERELGGRQARELVAFLVVNRRRTVSRDELLAALWADDAPRARRRRSTRCCRASGALSGTSGWWAEALCASTWRPKRGST